MGEQAIKECKAYILGDNTLGYYLASFFFSFLAIMLSLYVHSRSRDAASKNTPPDFSWYFLIWDNTKRVAVGMIAMFLYYRFVPIKDMAVGVAVGFFVSIGVDRAIQWLMKRFDFLRMNRENLPTKPQA